MNDKITDEEMDLFVGYQYRLMLEEEFLQTPYGKRIKSLEKLGIGITFEEAIDLYIEKAGITTDKVGNAIIEDDYASDVYQDNLQIISKQIGYDITQFSFEQIEKITNKASYSYSIKDFIIQENNPDKKDKNIESILEIFKEPKSLSEICKELDIFEAKYAPTVAEFSNILKQKGMSTEDAEKYVKNYEKQTIDTFIESASDIYLIEAISYLHLIKTGKLKLDYEAEKQMFLQIAETFKDSKYYERLLDENGKPDAENAEKFYLEFIEARNSSDLTRKISKYFTYTEIPDLDTEKDIFVTILRAYKSNDPVQIQSAMEIAKNLNIDVLEKKGSFNDKKIEKYGKKYFGKSFDVDEIVHLSEFNDDTIEEQLDRIMRSVLDQSPIPSIKTVDALNEYKEKQKEREKITCSKKDEVARSILNGKSNMNPEQILAIYCKFRCLELNERRIVNNNKEPVELTASNMAIPQNYGVASIIRKYIIENKEKFSEYLTESGDLENKKIVEALKNKEFSFNEQMDINSVFGEIRRQTKSIDRKEKEHFADIESLKNNIRMLSRGQLSEEKRKEMFKKAKHLQKDNILPTELIEKLKEVDPESFEKTFKKSDIEARVEQGSFRAFIYGKVGVSLRKAFVELPSQIFTRNGKSSDVLGIDQKLMKSLEKMRESKEKLAQKLVQGNLKKTDKENTNLPAVKKATIVDKIKAAFVNKKNEMNIEDAENKVENKISQDRATNSQKEGVEQENLTTTEKSDKTVTAKTGGLDYIKVETTPTISNNSTTVVQNNQNQTEIDNLEPEEPGIGD